ncbi:MAG: PilZ domain-containing protein [Nitrospirota bacterium]|nr:PilZ domain-containing protein [Nitrospirota bacterium]
MKTRYSNRETVQCTCVLSCEGIIGQGQLVNLSVPGGLLRSGMKLKVGQYLDMRLSFATSPSPLQVKLAAVRWVNGREAGIEFIRMSEADQTRLHWLASYVKKRVPQRGWSERIVCMGTAAA